jgi:hypothetical protein
MPGAPDPLYVRARAGLLDAVEALGLHRESVVLVGAQAIYLHTGDADLAVAEYTTDADFTLSPGTSPMHLCSATSWALEDSRLGRTPAAGSAPTVSISIPWFPRRSPAPVGEPQCLVPTAGKPSAEQRGSKGPWSIATGEPSHRWMRPTRGQEQPGSLVPAPSSSPRSTRSASASARKTACGKDALDVLRLLRAVATEDMADRRRGSARSSLPASVTAEALELLPSLFGEPNSDGVLMAKPRIRRQSLAR